MGKVSKKVSLISLFSSVYLIFSLMLYLNVSHVTPHRDLDSGGYEKKALSFYQTGSFIPTNQLKPPLVQQPLGYPLFMGAIYKAFGTHDFFLIWIQILLTLLSALLLFFAAQHLFGTTIALITHALFCCNIGYIVFAQFILAETLLTFFLVLFFERLAYFIKTKQLMSLGYSGLALGASTLVKPAAMYYLLPLVLILTPFVFAQKQLSLSKKTLQMFFLMACFLMPIKGYQLYNYVQYGVSNFGALGNYNLYVWFWGKVATDQQSPPSHLRQLLFAQERKKRTDMIVGNPLEFKSWSNLGQAFWSTVRQNPMLFAKTWTREMVKTYAGLYTTNLKVLVEAKTRGGDVSFFNTQGSIGKKIISYITKGTQSTIIRLIALFEFLWNIVRYLLVLLALAWLVRTRKWFLVLFFTSYIFYFSLVTGFDGCARYRTMFEFVLLLLAGVGIMVLLGKEKACEKQT